MQLLVHEAPHEVHRRIPEATADVVNDEPVLTRVRRTGVLRVGYHPDNLPFSYFNLNDQLVGFDVDMALMLASELGCKVEFIPFRFKTLADQIDNHDFDIAMSGVPVSTELLSRMTFSEPYLEPTVAFIVADHNRQKFSDIETLRQTPGIKLGIPRNMVRFERPLERYLPQAEVDLIESPRDFFSNLRFDLDGILLSAEAGAAWTLIYPNYQVVVPKADAVGMLLAYPVVGHDEELATFLSRWIALKRSGVAYQNLYDHWILGLHAQEKKPRWSVIRNVLHWVE
jgi:ABC-type amino acid transport substrate-binding protein